MIIRRLIGSLSKGRIIIVSTHIVSDIETIADKIVMIRAGEIIENGSVPEICKKVSNAEKTLENLYMQCYGDE